MDACSNPSHGPQPSAGASLAPVYFISHGTSLHTMDTETEVSRMLRTEGESLMSRCQVTAVIVVSAHWFGSDVVITSAPRPFTIHDHPCQYLYGFNYTARGDPVLAGRIAALLAAAGFSCKLDAERGWDHGAWLALAALLPTAPVPVVQLSLIPDDFDANVRLGGALACLREEGVVILASGSITHDQHEFRRGFLSNFGFETAMDGSLASKRKRRMALENAAVAPFSSEFDAWVESVLSDGSISISRRVSLLADYHKHRHGLQAHPEPSHFVPLFLAVGASALSDAPACTRVAKGFQYSLSMSAFRFN